MVKFSKPIAARRDNSLPYMPDIEDPNTPERHGALKEDPYFDSLSPTDADLITAAYQSASKIPTAHGKAQLMPGKSNKD